ncbi:MAG TPA: hydantoinase B/oxoprolinase family protein [Gammaproteobacteria bacterium]|nr:hydantoinase B/oxoprolinase family protein [Gammaproteobacteria bacterium]
MGWEFWIDRGGTFTDVVARAPSGEIRALKLLSEDPSRYADAAVAAIDRMLASAPAAERSIAAIKMGTTVATNALLERCGEPTVLVITAGLEDAIRIGGQQRPDIFALKIELPEMLYARVVSARERIGAGGDVLEALDERRLRADLEAAHAAGFRSAAIVLLHAYRYPQHENAAAALAESVGFTQVSVSHRVSPLPKLVLRGDTTLVDAYLSPVLRRYVASVRRGLEGRLGGTRLLFMQSHGGLAAAERFAGKDSLLSGPAGGVIGMVHAARSAGFTEVVGFDMGGTSTDVSLYAGELERTADALIARVRVSAPMLKIHTVAAGGGSILKFAHARFQVGPESAGALPGPACYRNGGPLTVTDANVLLGRIQRDFFPRVFGPDGDAPLDVDETKRAFAALAESVAAATGEPITPAALAAGFRRVAIEHMANAIKQISVQRGHDVTRFALCCFGGAAGQHACEVADAVGIGSIVIHPLAGVLSAYGIGVADLRVLRRRSVEAPLAEALLRSLERDFAALADEARVALATQGADAGSATLERRLAVRIAGTDTPLPVRFTSDTTIADLRAAFAAAHERHFGFRAPDDAQLVVESIELEAAVASVAGAGGGVSNVLRETVEKGTFRFSRLRRAVVHVQSREKRNVPFSTRSTAADPQPVAKREVWSAGAWRATPIFERAALPAGAAVAGPAVIAEPNATTVVEPGWRAALAADGSLILTRARRAARKERVRERASPLMLEVFNNLFMHAAEEMGVVLERSAHSVNIKERLDFSCALFDAEGGLIANAPHIPVHLGSMGDSVQSVLRLSPRPGDSYLLNTPYNGGTHLPDVTVVTPVFAPGGRRLRYVVASRAHHADIGGITPGSMPPQSRTIHEEGVLLDGVRIVARGRFHEAELRRLLASAPYPARNPDQNVADLKAQLAANARGIAKLDEIGARFGWRTIAAYMRHVQDNAEQCVREAIGRLRDGRFTVELDGGERIAVEIAIDSARRAATIDFSGTSPMSAGNFNAPPSIVRAAVLYVFRTLVREDIPLNAGCLTPLTIRLPAPSLLCPSYPAAVVAGNVETSQCVTDALLGALDACAAAQGTMNNFTFGNARHQYYETICGGAGAGPDFPGASAVHTHMTNSRLTDAEILEARYPVRVRRFAIRRGSGGAGAQHGGDGVVREIEFLEPMQAAILANRRRVPPFGLHGGEPGLCGKNYVVRAGGAVEPLAATASVELAAGDRFVIETPGGGGYGRARAARATSRASRRRSRG